MVERLRHEQLMAALQGMASPSQHDLDLALGLVEPPADADPAKTALMRAVGLRG